MNDEFFDRLIGEHTLCETCPSPAEVAKFFRKLLGFFYLDFSTKPLRTENALKVEMEELKVELKSLLSRNPMNAIKGIDKINDRFFDGIRGIYELLNLDIMAIYEGDPACQSRREVIRTYPGFYAIAAYRVANLLYVLDVEDLPRVITEHAHSLTGVDIHPGATIGKSFCIDHGTGIVIGQTSIIHDYVKIYQGVTLGALSVQKCDANMKRHPTIESDCVLYAGSTILGGETVIGAGSVIGGNVWITKSVPPKSKLYYQAKMNTDDNIDVVVFKDFAK
jgi:serine O-acetyltransferase